MIEYDLLPLFDQPLRFRSCLPSAIVTFGGELIGECVLDIQWRTSARYLLNEDELRLTWDVSLLKPYFAEIEEEIGILRERDEDQAARTELAAVVVAVAVMTHLEPNVQFTRRSRTGTGHDYYLNDTREEMIEIAGRWEGGLPGLFDEKRQQSDLHPHLQKRWVSVTIIRESPRNRTERVYP